jgi:hypothetical protein
MRGFKMRLRDKAVFCYPALGRSGAEARFCGAFAIGDRIAGGVWGAPISLDFLNRLTLGTGIGVGDASHTSWPSGIGVGDASYKDESSQGRPPTS